MLYSLNLPITTATFSYLKIGKPKGSYNVCGVVQNSLISILLLHSLDTVHYIMLLIKFMKR